MNNKHLKLLSLLIPLFGCGIDPPDVATSENAVSPGSAVWISGDSNFTAIARDGVQVAPLARVPWSNGAPLEHVRGLTLDPSSSIAFFNGTFNPVLSITTTSDTWQQRMATGWSTISNISFGGVDAIGEYIFATDMYSALPGTDRGLIRFHPSDSTFTRFQTTSDFIDVSVGADRRVYALKSDMRTVQVYDPNTMLRLGSTVLAIEVRGIATNAQHALFGAAWNGNVYRFTSSGQIAATFNPGIGSLIDIDLSSDGTIAVGSSTNQIAFVDPSFASANVFTMSGVSATSGIFVAFDEPALQ